MLVLLVLDLILLLSLGAVIARQNMKDRSGASVMDPTTQVTSVHGHTVLELALQPLQANFALPLVAERDIVVEVVGELISKPYIEITLNLLQRFGIEVRRDGSHLRQDSPSRSASPVGSPSPASTRTTRT